MRTQYQDTENFREHVDNLLACLPAMHGIVDLQPLFFRLTLDTTTALLLGQSVHSLKAEFSQDAKIKAFAESFDIAQTGLAKRFRMAPWHSLYNPPAFRLACSMAHRFVDSYIRERGPNRTGNSEKGSSNNFLDQTTEESNGQNVLRDQLLNILLAGRDTTACCLSWTIRLLVREASVMERLRLEINTFLGKEEHPTREHIRKIPYLALVIKESATPLPSTFLPDLQVAF